MFTTNDLVELIETNAINLGGDIDVDNKVVTFNIVELSVFSVTAFVQGGMIIEICDGEIRKYTPKQYAKFLRCEEDSDSLGEEVY